MRALTRPGLPEALDNVEQRGRELLRTSPAVSQRDVIHLGRRYDQDV